MIDYSDYILWIQSDTNESDDIILVDGKKPNDNLRHSYFSHIFPGVGSNWREINLRLDKNAQSGVSKSLKLYQSFSNKEVLITSNFITLDNKQRRVAYMFCTKTLPSMEQICAKMHDTFKDMHYDVNPNDISFLIEKISIKKKRAVRIAVYSILALAVLIIILWKVLF